MVANRLSGNAFATGNIITPLVDKAIKMLTPKETSSNENEQKDVIMEASK